MPSEMSGTTSLTLLVVSLYLCGILARRNKNVMCHAALMSAGFLGDMGLTIYLVVKIHVLGQFAEPKQYAGALALLIVHTLVAVALLVGYAGSFWYGGKQFLVQSGWHPQPTGRESSSQFKPQFGARHRAWGYFTLVTYCITLILIPSGGPVAWLLKNLFTK